MLTTTTMENKIEIKDVVTKVVEINRNGKFDTEGRLVLFPKYTFYLVDRCKEVNVVGDKIGDRKLVSLMIDRLLMGQEVNRDADVLVFDIKKKIWTEIYVTENNVELTIQRKGYDSYMYYSKLCDESTDINESFRINAISNFIKINSSANLQIR